MNTNSGVYSDIPNKKASNICGGYLYPPIHTNDNYFMCFVAGIRLPLVHPISFAKTDKEKAELARAKRENIGEVSKNGISPRKNSKQEIRGTLTIYVENTEVDKSKRNIFKTTYSFKIEKSEILNFISDFGEKHKVKKYYFKY